MLLIPSEKVSRRLDARRLIECRSGWNECYVTFFASQRANFRQNLQS